MSFHSIRPAHHVPSRAHRYAMPVAALLSAILLTACGGGGGNPGGTGTSSGANGAATGTGGTGTLVTAPPSAPGSLQLVTAVPADKSIVLQGQGGSGRTENATLTYKLLDTNGNPLVGKLVTFSTSSTNVKLNTPSGVTDASGLVSASVNSMAVPTTFRVTATVANSATNGGADISTVSDSITVTTGLPVQRAFSISVENFNIDGWNTDDVTTNVNILIADAYGNPVPDGTPVVFQTNVGSIGTAARGGCVTTNGKCSVPYRSQAPRVAAGPNLPATPCNTGTGSLADETRIGVATICASSTDGTTTLRARTTITLSSHAGGGYVYVDGSDTKHPNGSEVIDLGSTSNAVARTVVIELNDVNGNPLAKDTTVSIEQAQNLTVVGPTPDKVPNQPLDFSLSGHQGSKHSIVISSTTKSADPTACKPSTGTFTFQSKTAGGVVMQFPFKLAFTCP